MVVVRRVADGLMSQNCPICAIHQDVMHRDRYEVQRSELWVLRHHPDPSPLPGWLILDTLRHCPGPIDFTNEEAAGWGRAVQQASRLVQRLTKCDRVYAIAFGEGAQHLHLHLIPRFIADSSTTAWAVADHYRAVQAKERSAADMQHIQAVVREARLKQSVLD